MTGACSRICAMPDCAIKLQSRIGDPTYADAILDRIVHNAHRINLTGHSLRRSRATKQQRSDLPPDAKTAVDH